ncbi:fungal cellulose binding domain-containing protein [Microdochium trichocladiopsis]|uniref:lytic cellulose monooxygenase (C4-dehydrogenating) n=1 Tax=Microdochium trichocladiopsis TaxID=1682393 RepID=A0A9P8Y5D4_9PEZI|nr:fungal cellulose binding domain-containing protein [Microdochium trichocladiopsis]KAH7029882.1 fungal cellulose binding domain-containing protein [Microdochium trichocladiopsis]
MKVTSVLGAALATQGAAAHYFFDVVTHKGSTTPSFRYIRDFTRPTRYNPIKFSSNPAADIRDGSYADRPDIRCNQGAFSKAGNTQVLTVNAGDELKVTLGVGATMQHPGPGLVYMSRAPNDNVKAYDGSGDWFKIKQEGVCNSGGDFTTNAWCTWDRNYLTAVIPKDVPSGEYLVRFEHIGVHRSHVNQPEHYTSCVQVKVQGGGSGTPGPLVKFPGAYKASDGYANFSVYNGHKSFPFPGPAVWSGGSSGGGGGGGNGGGNTGGGGGSGGGGGGGSCAALYGQCGGEGWAGAKCCSAGTCKASNQYYSQCL